MQGTFTRKGLAAETLAAARVALLPEDPSRSSAADFQRPASAPQAEALVQRVRRHTKRSDAALCRAEFPVTEHRASREGDARRQFPSAADTAASEAIDEFTTQWPLIRCSQLWKIPA